MLAFRATVAVATLKRAEAINGSPGISAAEASRLERTLHGQGIEFTGTGVRFRASDEHAREALLATAKQIDGVC